MIEFRTINGHGTCGELSTIGCHGDIAPKGGAPKPGILSPVCDKQLRVLPFPGHEIELFQPCKKYSAPQYGHFALPVSSIGK
jgi:hypothetical protein